MQLQSFGACANRLDLLVFQADSHAALPAVERSMPLFTTTLLNISQRDCFLLHIGLRWLETKKDATGAISALRPLEKQAVMYLAHPDSVPKSNSSSESEPS